MQEMRKLGSMKDILSMLPGIGNKIKDADIDESALGKTEAIIRSMTPKERANPDIINPSRKRRIAAGCGMQVEVVNRLLSQFKQMQKMFKQMNSKGNRKKMRRMGGMGGFPGMM